MPATKGNQFWKLRSSHGRKPKFSNPEDLESACYAYFEQVEANPIMVETSTKNGIVKLARQRPFTVAGLCVFLDISEDTWANYKKDKDLIGVTTRIDQVMRSQKFEGASAGIFNANIIARDLGLADKQEVKAKVNVKKTMSEFYADAKNSKINKDK